MAENSKSGIKFESTVDCNVMFNIKCNCNNDLYVFIKNPPPPHRQSSIKSPKMSKKFSLRPSKSLRALVSSSDPAPDHPTSSLRRQQTAQAGFGRRSASPQPSPELGRSSPKSPRMSQKSPKTGLKSPKIGLRSPKMSLRSPKMDANRKRDSRRRSSGISSRFEPIPEPFSVIIYSCLAGKCV